MPHAVIEGEIDLAAFARDFEPFLLREAGDVLRTGAIYLETRGRAALVDAVVVERGRKQTFYVRLSRHDRGALTVRVDPGSHPDRSEGVRSVVGRIVSALLARNPHARLGATNLVLPSAADGGESDEDCPGHHGADWQHTSGSPEQGDGGAVGRSRGQARGRQPRQ